MVDKVDMEYYLVGGAIRDYLMDNEPKDRDYVVVGETPATMKERGFKQVGKGFPVFLDNGGTEYALARTEDKTGKGYDAFDCEWQGISLKEDLSRRDLTINAIAMDTDTEEIIDPYNGKEDIEDRKLRPVSEAFVEDPLRVLRMARYATRFEQEFNIVDKLWEMAKEVAPELEYLPGERIGEEIIKACKQSKHISSYFDTLSICGALKVIAPELDRLRSILAGYSDHHNEGNTWRHTMMVLMYTEDLRPNNPKAYLMALCHDLGKIETAKNSKDNHGGHDKKGCDIAEKLAKSWKLSNEYKQAMINGSRFHIRLLNLPEMKSGKTIKFVDKLSRYNVDLLLDLIEADKKGRVPAQDFDKEKIKKHIEMAQKAIANYTGQDLIDEGYEGSGGAFGQTLLNRRANLYSKYITGVDI